MGTRRYLHARFPLAFAAAVACLWLSPAGAQGSGAVSSPTVEVGDAGDEWNEDAMDAGTQAPAPWPYTGGEPVPLQHSPVGCRCHVAPGATGSSAGRLLASGWLLLAGVSVLRRRRATRR